MGSQGVQASLSKKHPNQHGSGPTNLVSWFLKRQYHALVHNWQWYRASLTIALTIFVFLVSQPESVNSLVPVTRLTPSTTSYEFSKLSSVNAARAGEQEASIFLQVETLTSPALADSSFLAAAARVQRGEKCTPKTQKWDCKSTEACIDSKCAYCTSSDQCTDFPAYTCVKPDGLSHNVCRHKPLLPKVSSADIITSILAFIFCMMAGGGGVGGGSLLVPILVVVNRFQPHEAIPLSKATIFAGSIGNLILNLFKSHPYDSRRVLIDYEAATVLEPIALYGTVVGVVFTRIFPEWVIFITLVTVLGYMSYKTIVRAIKLYHTETRMMELAQRSALEREQLYIAEQRAAQGDDANGIARVSSAVSDGNGSGSERSGRPGFQTSFAADNHYVTDSDSSSEDDSANQANLGLLTNAGTGSDSEGTMRSRNQFLPPSSGPASVPPGSPVVADGAYADESKQVGDEMDSDRALLLGAQSNRGVSRSSDYYGTDYAPPEGFDPTLHLRYAPDQDDEHDEFDPALTPVDSSIEVLPPPRDEDERAARLAELLEYEKELHSHPISSFVVILIAEVIIVVTMILLGGEGNGSIVGIKCGSTVYWILWALLLPTILSIVVLLAYRARTRYVRKVQLGFRFLRGDVQWSVRSLIMYPFISFTAGLAAGMIGVGGGTIKAPLLLELGLIPETTAATVAYMIFFTSSCTTSQFLIHGMLQYDYALWYAIIGFIATMLGQFVAQKLVDLYKRPSFLIFTIAAVTALGSAMLTVQGSFQLSDDVQHNKHMGFRDMCD